MASVHVFKNGTNLRTTGEIRPDNIIKAVDSHEYKALHQCQGDFVKEGNDENTWWIKIVAGDDDGWVSAVRVKEGGNDDPVPGVKQQKIVWGWA